MSLSDGMIKKAKYLSEGNTIPTCSNHGCDRDVLVRDWRYFSFKHHCSDCMMRLRKGMGPREGVSFIKKDYCENIDGRLGFICPVDKNWLFTNNVLHEDHIDGNHQNNVPENIQTLCPICHHTKGVHAGDFDSSKKGRKFVI